MAKSFPTMKRNTCKAPLVQTPFHNRCCPSECILLRPNAPYIEHHSCSRQDNAPNPYCTVSPSLLTAASILSMCSPFMYSGSLIPADPSFFVVMWWDVEELTAFFRRNMCHTSFAWRAVFNYVDQYKKSSCGPRNLVLTPSIWTLLGSVADENKRKFARELQKEIQ